MQTETLHIAFLGWQWSKKQKKGSWAKIKGILFTPLGTQAAPRLPRGSRRSRGQEDSELSEDPVMESGEKEDVTEEWECGLGEQGYHYQEPSSSSYHGEVVIIR